MTRRFNSTGQGTPWQLHPGYQRTSRYSSRWEKPDVFSRVLIVGMPVATIAVIGFSLWRVS